MIPKGLSQTYIYFFRGLNKEELELYTEMKARRDAEDEAKRATESSDEEVVIIIRMRTAFVCMKRNFLTFAKNEKAKRATESSDEEVVMIMRISGVCLYV